VVLSTRIRPPPSCSPIQLQVRPLRSQTSSREEGTRQAARPGCGHSAKRPDRTAAASWGQGCRSPLPPPRCWPRRGGGDQTGNRGRLPHDPWRGNCLRTGSVRWPDRCNFRVTDQQKEGHFDQGLISRHSAQQPEAARRAPELGRRPGLWNHRSRRRRPNKKIAGVQGSAQTEARTGAASSEQDRIQSASQRLRWMRLIYWTEFWQRPDIV